MNESPEEFVTRYNRVHRAICNELGVDETTDFVKAAKAYAEKRTSWRYTEDLKVIAKLRNVLVHEQFRVKEYLAHPSATSIMKLDKVLDALEKPKLIVPMFQREVVTVQYNQTLSDVLPLVLEQQYSQFPVYDEQTFQGLLTESGVIRYLAQYRAAHDSLIELADVSVHALLEKDENQKNYVFAPRSERVDETVGRFSSNPVLEAVLVTANGKKKEQLMGIVTRWDALDVQGDL